MSNYRNLALQHMFIKLEPIKVDLTTTNGRREMAIRVSHLPDCVRKIVVEFLKELIRTCAPYNSIRVLDSIQCVYENERLSRPNHVWSDEIYYDYCRGYCMKCGDPQPTKQWKSLTSKRQRFRLARNGLCTMGMCVACIRYGFNFEVHPIPIQDIAPIYYFPNHDESVSFNIVLAIRTAK